MYNFEKHGKLVFGMPSYYRLPFKMFKRGGHTACVAISFPLRKHAYSNIMKILPPKLKIFR